MDVSQQKCFFISGTSRESANKEIITAFAQELVSRGHQVIILVDGQRKDLEDPSSNPAIYTWPSRRPTHLKDGLFLARLIKAYQPTCLIAQFGSVNLMVIVGWLCGVRHRIPWYETLSTQIDTDALIPRWKIVLLRLRKRMVFWLASSFFANSNAAKKDLIKTFKVKENKITVFYNNIKDPLLSDAQLASKKPIHKHLVCVGRFNNTKGQDILIKAARGLMDIPDLVIEFVGSGQLFEEYQELAKQIGVEHLCRFSGSVPYKQVFAKFAESAASIVPSRSEAFGYVCIESLSVGTPVIGANTGGISEIVRDGIDGYLFDPEDVGGLTVAIRKLIFAKDVEYLQMRSNARKRFLESFEQKAVISENTDRLEKIILKT